MYKGKLILLVGPSGSGKGTLLAYVRATFPQITLPTSWTTRAPRAGEQEGSGASGKSYHFVTAEQFKAHIAEGGFLEWAQYGDNYYGTLKDEVLNNLEQGHVILQELEIQGARQIREKVAKEDLKIIFIDAGSWDELQNRITGREVMSESELEHRRIRYEEEISFAPEADFIIHNARGKLEESKEKISEIIKSLLV